MRSLDACTRAFRNVGRALRFAYFWKRRGITQGFAPSRLGVGRDV